MVTIIVDAALVAAFLAPWRVDMRSFRRMKPTTEDSFVCIYSYKTTGSLIGAQFNNRLADSRYFEEASKCPPRPTIMTLCVPLPACATNAMQRAKGLVL